MEAGRPTPDEARTALAELTLRRAQLVAAHDRERGHGGVRPLHLALTLAGHVASDLGGRRGKIVVRGAAIAFELASGLVTPSDRMVTPAHFWIGEASGRFPARDDAEDAEDAEDDSDDFEQPPHLRRGPYGCLPLLALAVVGVVLRRRLEQRLGARGSRWPSTISGALVMLLSTPPMLVLQRRLRQRNVLRVLLPDVADPTSFPTGWEPAPIRSTALDEPRLLALTGLLAPAGAVSRRFLRTTLTLDDATLDARLAQLRDAGWLEPAPSRLWRAFGLADVSLTPAGRAAVAAHAAWLRERAAEAA